MQRASRDTKSPEIWSHPWELLVPWVITKAISSHYCFTNSFLDNMLLSPIPWSYILDQGFTMRPFGDKMAILEMFEGGWIAFCCILVQFHIRNAITVTLNGQIPRELLQTTILYSAFFRVQCQYGEYILGNSHHDNHDLYTNVTLVQYGDTALIAVIVYQNHILNPYSRL